MSLLNQAITVIKRSPGGKEIWRYDGTILNREPDRIILEARFNRPDLPFMGTVLRLGDRFVEAYYFQRWYNVFEIHDRQNDMLKGWYCNISRPALLESESAISYEDLALDLWVSPQGVQTILDENEFAELHLDEVTQAHGRAALEDLQRMFGTKQMPDF